MRLLGVVVYRLRAVRHVTLASEDSATKTHVESHRRGLIDNNKTGAVCVIHELLGVRVVAGTHGVSADPLQVVEVTQHQPVVLLFADDRVILVHPKTGEVEGLTVDKELGAANLDGADPDALVVNINNLIAFEDLDNHVVQVPLARLPQVHIHDFKVDHAVLGFSTCNLDTLSIHQGGANRGFVSLLAYNHERGVDLASLALVVRDNSDIIQVSLRHRNQFHRPSDSRVVVEVVEVKLLPVDRHTRRNGLKRELVVHTDGEQELLAPLDQIGDVQVERQVAALVRPNLCSVYPNLRGVCGRGEVNANPAAIPTLGDAHRALVPNVSVEVALGSIRHDVVEGGGDSHLLRFRQRLSLPILFPTDSLLIKFEIPKSVQGDQFACWSYFWS